MWDEFQLRCLRGSPRAWRVRHRGRLSGRSGRSSRGARSLGLTDQQLLERFNARRDPVGEAAFAALVTRHGPMVLDICHKVVGDLHLAEDAFQAVFLVLARKTRSISNPDLLSNWLYGVALRTARKAKARLARQRKHEEEGSMRPPGFGIEHRGRSLGPTSPGSRGRGGAARRDCPVARVISSAGGPLLLRGHDPRRGGATAPLAGGYGP